MSSVEPNHDGLRVQGLACQRRDRWIFRDLGFSLSPGEILQVEGSNGAGKTTLLKMLVGLAVPHHGEIRWCGECLPQAGPRLHADMAYLGHPNGIKLLLSPLENLRWSLGLAGVRAEEDRLVGQLVDLSLGHALDQPCATLSAGQRRRVALARVFLSRRRLWVLDEPFTALDRETLPRMEACLRAHAAAGGMIAFTAHQAHDLGPAHRRLRIGGEGMPC